MKLPLDRARPFLFPLAALAAFGFAAGRSREAMATRNELRETERRVKQLAPAPDFAGRTNGQTQGITAAISQAAKTSGVKRLLSVGVPGDGKNIPIEWEADQRATLRFLSVLQSPAVAGGCVRLEITAADEHALVHARGLFDPGSSAAATAGPQVLAARNVFAPLWADRREISQETLAAQTKKLEEAQRLEQQKQEQERKTREESQQLEAKKRELETQLVVNGIVNNGREAMAFVNSRMQGGQTLMVRNGDMVADARVTMIDEKRGEVQLDYLGKFQVSLRLTP